MFGFGLFDSGDYFLGEAGHQVVLQVANHCAHEGSSKPGEDCLNLTTICILSLAILTVPLEYKPDWHVLHMSSSKLIYRGII